MSDVQRFSDEVQRAGKKGFDAAVSAFGEANKGFQAIAAEITAYSKKSLEDGTRAFEQLLGAKSFQQAHHREDLQGRRKPSIQLNQEPAIVVRKSGLISIPLFVLRAGGMMLV